ncbi:MAG TPA: hypothetical protein VGP25_18010 [Gemmatimonadaceae bacterium]|jgi:pimeloyl-ACP methyl ester carboxylesterase|nr:hypothetical protein [Gemmatimonadaceae bacterium]
MLNPPPSTSLAEVRAHDQVMRYRRAGAGRPIVVLRSAPDSEPLWPELEEWLAGAFRVITPEIPRSGADVARWLGDFLEGVGLEHVTLVATEGYCLPALELALLGADQIERLVLVPAGYADETGLAGTLATSLAGVAVPLLVVRRGLSAIEALPLLRHFMQSRADGAIAG